MNDCYCGQQPHCSHDTDARSSLELAYWKRTAKIAEAVLIHGASRDLWCAQLEKEIRPVDPILYEENCQAEDERKKCRVCGQDPQNDMVLVQAAGIGIIKIHKECSDKANETFGKRV